MSLMKKLDKLNSVFHRSAASSSDRNNTASNNNALATKQDKDQTAVQPTANFGPNMLSTSSSFRTSTTTNNMKPMNKKSHALPMTLPPESDAQLQKRLDVLGKSLARISRKITRYIQSAQQVSSTDTHEKRLSKMTEHALSVNFREEYQQIESAVGESRASTSNNFIGADYGTCLAAVLKSCEDCYHFIAESRLTCDKKVEELILLKLDSTAAELANCEKERKQYEKQQKELAADEAKLVQAERHLSMAPVALLMGSTNVTTTTGPSNVINYAGVGSAAASALPGTQPSPMESKVSSLRNEVDDKRARVEQQRDFFNAGVCSLIAREKEITDLFVQLLKFTAAFHESALRVINATLPEIEAIQKRHACSPCYGIDLDRHLDESGRSIALPVEACIYTLVSCGGLKEEGLFRVAGSASKTRRLKAALDAGVTDMSDYRSDFSVLGDALKAYLRELPIPLLNNSLYSEWIAAGQVPDAENSRRNAVGTVIRKLPTAYRNNLLYLTAFLARLSDDAASNKMTITNLAIIMGPNLLWSTTTNNNMQQNTGVSNAKMRGAKEIGSIGRVGGNTTVSNLMSEAAYFESMQDAGPIHNVVECLIRHSSYFLSPDNIDFTRTEAVYLPGDKSCTVVTTTTALSPSGSVAALEAIQEPAAMPSLVSSQRLYPALARAGSSTPVGRRMEDNNDTISGTRSTTSSRSSSMDYVEQQRQQQQVAAASSANNSFDAEKLHAANDVNTMGSSSNQLVASLKNRKPTVIPVKTPAYDAENDGNNIHLAYPARAVDSSNTTLSSRGSGDDKVTGRASPKITRRSTTQRKSRPAPPPPSVQQQIKLPPTQPIFQHHRAGSAGDARTFTSDMLPPPPAPPPPRAEIEDDELFTDSCSSSNSSGEHHSIRAIRYSTNSPGETDDGKVSLTEAVEAVDKIATHHQSDFRKMPIPSVSESLSSSSSNTNNNNGKVRPQRPPAPHSTTAAARMRSPIVEAAELSPAAPLTPFYAAAANPIQTGINNNATRSYAGVDAVSSSRIVPASPKSLYPTDIVAEASKSYLPDVTATAPQRYYQSPTTPPVRVADAAKSTERYNNAVRFEFDKRQQSSPLQTDTNAAAAAGDSGDAVASVANTDENLAMKFRSSEKGSSQVVSDELAEKLQKRLANLVKNTPDTKNSSSKQRLKNAEEDDENSGQLSSASVTAAPAGSTGGTEVFRPKVLPKPVHLSTTSSVKSCRSGSTSSAEDGAVSEIPDGGNEAAASGEAAVA